MGITEAADGQRQPAWKPAVPASPKSPTVLLGALLVALRLPFMATHHMQEDAFISFRCARNLALGLGYGFNAGERVSASTSHAYVFLAAAAYRAFGEAFIPVLQLIGACSVVAGIYWIASAASCQQGARDLLWLFGSVTPVAISISYLGMETPLLMLVVGALVLDLKRPLPRVISALLLGLLPWIRPDAMAIALIFLACQVLRDRRFNWAGASALVAGAGAWFAFNRLYFGQWLNQSIVAKGLQSQSRHSLAAFQDNLARLFLGVHSHGTASLFTPLATKYLLAIQPLFSLAGVAVCAWAMRVAWRSSELRPPLAALLGLGLLLPIPYAWGNVIYPWYLQPSELCLVLLALLFLLHAAARARPKLRAGVLLGTSAVVVCLAVGQWALAVNWGAQGYYDRGRVGRYLRSISSKHDTLLLEPAGYIPFYSWLYTWDEVGIVSPEVTRFQKKFGPEWWVRFVEAKRPTFLVERDHMLSYKTSDGFALSPAERAWFDRNYRLIYKTSYRPEALLGNRLLQRIAKMGGGSDYLIYRLVPESASVER